MRFTTASIFFLLAAASRAALGSSRETTKKSVQSDPWIHDFIQELPDFGRTPTPHFSGYLDGSDGCHVEINGPECQIHYWLALAEHEPASAPVVLWLNGGPGSSSILGFLQELGPLMMNAKGGLMENPYSWTKYVNLMAIEAPIGVGYSYCTRQRVHGKPCENTDRYTASTSRAALVDFFTNKFPEFAKNDFFITGESYAGVYIPTLSKEILDHTDIPLKGIAVGDPCTDNKAQAESMDSLWYAHKNGLVDDEVYDLLWNQCDVRLPNLMTRGGVHHVVHELNRELRTIDDLHQRRNRAKALFHQVILGDTFRKIRHSSECTLAFRKFLLSSSNALSQSWKDLYVDDYSLFSPVSSLEDEQMAAYMSREDVRKALHVENAPTVTWPYASVGFHYYKEYDACNWQDDIVMKGVSMVDIYKEIVPKLERTWIYNGDTDPCVSYEGTRLAVKQIQVNELDGGGYRPWFFNQTAASIEVLVEKSPLFGPDLVAQNMGSQFGGEVTDYEMGLKFITFHGSGHMVPQFRPQSALHFIQKFVNNEFLSPLMPLNQTLVELSEEEFRDAADAWTEEAMMPPYVTSDNRRGSKMSEEWSAVE
jgi:Carboxypeptidase C (cathepsin A)